MVGRLVKKEDIGADEHGAGELELHLPTTRERSDRVHLLLVRETDVEKRGGDPLARDVLEVRVGGDEAEDVGSGVLALKGMLDHDGPDLVLRRVVLDLAVADGFHERRLALSVAGANTVAVSTVKTELGVVEEEETSIGKREHDVAEELALGAVVNLVGGEALLRKEQDVRKRTGGTF